MLDHQDVLAQLNRESPLQDKLRRVHEVIGGRFAFVHRVAVAVHDPQTDELRTFIDSNDRAGQVLSHYSLPLSEVPSLVAVRDAGRPRVVDDLAVFDRNASHHSGQLQAQGFRSSYTVPMYLDGRFHGFVFFNSRQRGVFCEPSIGLLDVFGHLVALMIMTELQSLRTVVATLKSARDVAHHRDVETGSHLDRMAHYSQLIAREVADDWGLDDEFVHYMLLAAPLHDIGKLGIPDSILLKPGKLTEQEWAVMRSHSARGREIVDTLVRNFGLEGANHIGIVRNIAQCHHEVLDGSGYPDGLAADAIPKEARIVTVADIFDALTSQRPYKRAWSNDEAFDHLQDMAGAKLDARCVQALADNRGEVEEIQRRFAENPFG